MSRYANETSLNYVRQEQSSDPVLYLQAAGYVCCLGAVVYCGLGLHPITTIGKNLHRVHKANCIA